MSGNQETVADIIDEMRAKAKHFDDGSGLMVSESALALYLYPIADRLEAAWKRGALFTEAAENVNSESAIDTGDNNEQKLREALEKVNRHASAIMAITTVPELYAESIKVVLHHAVEIGFVSAETLAEEGDKE